MSTVIAALWLTNSKLPAAKPANKPGVAAMPPPLSLAPIWFAAVRSTLPLSLSAKSCPATMMPAAVCLISRLPETSRTRPGDTPSVVSPLLALTGWFKISAAGANPVWKSAGISIGLFCDGPRYRRQASTAPALTWNWCRSSDWELCRPATGSARRLATARQRSRIELAPCPVDPRLPRRSPRTAGESSSPLLVSEITPAEINPTWADPRVTSNPPFRVFIGPSIVRSPAVVCRTMLPLST